MKKYIITWKCNGEEEIYTSVDEYSARISNIENQGYERDIDFYIDIRF